MVLSRRWFFSFLLIVFVGIAGVATGRAAELLYVFQPNNPDLDGFMIEYLEQRHTVISLDSADPGLRDAALQADLVFVAESIGSGTIDPDANGTVFHDVSTPVILAEVFAWDNAFFTGDIIHFDFGNTGRPEAADASEDFVELLDTIHIVDAAHPLAGGFTGEVKVYEEPFSISYAAVESLGAGANVVATVDAAGNYAATFVYEQGAELADGSTAAGRRIGIFLGQGSALPTPPGPLLLFDYISEDGLKLVDAAINYALGLGGVPGDFDGNGTLDLADIDLLSAASASRMNDVKFDLDDNGLVNRDDVALWIKSDAYAFSWIGDSDLNGRFDSGDFVKVFTTGKYETGQAAVWSEGDWNGDGVFNSTDFVSAFTDGGYEAGNRAAVAAVPEPSGLMLTLLALMGVCSSRRNPRRFRV